MAEICNMKFSARFQGFVTEANQQILPVIEASGGSPFSVRLESQLCYELLKEQRQKLPYQWLLVSQHLRMRMCLGRGTSPRSMSAQKQDAQGAGCSKETSEFVNHGLLLWNESRQKWVGHKKAATRSQLLLVLKSRTRPCMTRKLWLCCLDPGKGNHKMLQSNKPFTKPVPLGEMVDTLVDVWEDEGMYEMV